MNRSTEGRGMSANGLDESCGGVEGGVGGSCDSVTGVPSQRMTSDALTAR